MSVFDGPNLLITLDAPTAGVLSINWADLYEEWLVWLSTGYGNRGYPPVFTEDFGGNPLVGAVTAGAYFVFNNDLGWRVKPYEADHTIYAAAQFPPADSTLPIMVPTVGGYTVFADGLQQQTQVVTSGSGLSAAQDAKLTDIHDEAVGKWHVDHVAKTLTLYRVGGSVLKVFNLTSTEEVVPAFVTRTPV